MKFEDIGEEFFNAQDGWCFKRLEDGSVRIRKQVLEGSADVAVDVVFPPGIWGSVIANCSYYGEDDYGWYRAMNFHLGGHLDATTPLNQERLRP